jgi:hypothetical protein
VERLLRRKSRSGVGIALGAAAFGLVSAAGLLAATYRPDQETPESDTTSEEGETESQAS